MKKRSVYLLICALCLIVGVVIVSEFSSYSFIRGTIGDCLVIVLIYYLLKLFVEIRPLKLVIVVLIFSYAVEISQYFKLIEMVRLEDSFIANVIMGSTFDYRDLLAYTLGACVAYIIDVKFLNK